MTHASLDGHELTEIQRQELLREWNDTRAEYPRELCIHELFLEQAERAPDAPALRFAASSGIDSGIGSGIDFEIGEWSYGELAARSARLARRLRALGVGPDVPVAFCLRRSPQAVLVMLAVLRAGGAYVPLDPDYPADRLAFMLADAAAPVLVTERALAPRLPPSGARVLFLEDPAPDPEPEPEPEPEPPGCARAFPQNLAYIIYTSGSTGRPKGVAVPHAGVVRLVRETNYLDFSPDLVILLLSSLSFDVSTMEIWGALLNGGCLAIFPPHPPGFAELAEAVERFGLTTLWLTAGLFHQVVSEVGGAPFRGLRHLLAGGDALSAPHLRRALRDAPGCALINGYGPTENTTFTSCHRMTAPEEVDDPVPIGRPISNTRVILLDAAMNPVPPGRRGELCAGGDGVARGYLNRPELTAEKFVPDPLGAPGERLYRTGDLSRFRPDGVLEFFGRIDQQVKIRGFRIEPGEIETALLEHPEVRDCAVVALAGEDGKRLVAYVVAAAETRDSGALRAFLRGRLPEHMVPSGFAFVRALPLNPSGKVDRRALPGIATLPETVEGRAWTAPSTPREELLAEIWAGVLGVPRVGAEDSFFDLGGDSLLATRLVSRVREALGAELPLRALFEAPTVAGLAAWIGESDTAALPPVRRVRREGWLPLSFAQERLWLVDRLSPGLAVYNLPYAVRLRGELDLPALERALGEIVRRHEALRTSFAASGGEPRQVVHPFEPMELPVADLTEAELAEHAREMGRRPFDLERERRLLRAELVRLGPRDSPREYALLLNLHHIAGDGWSMEVLGGELEALYSGAVLPEPPVQYADFAVWQREWLSGGVLERQVAWWKEALAGAPTLLDLPSDRPRPPVQSFRGASLAATLPAALAAGLRRLGRQRGATPFMVLLAAFQGLLYRYTGADDLLVGTPVANRRRQEVEGLIGFFVNTLVLRARPSGEEPFLALLERARAVSLGAFAHQDLPFERLVEELRAERGLSHNPLFQVVFAYQGRPKAVLEMPGLEAAMAPVDIGQAPFELALAVWETGEELSAVLDYGTDLFDATTAARLLGHYRSLVAGIAEAPDRPLADLPLLTAAERQQLLEWNDTRWYAADRGADWMRPVHRRFERRAAERPDAVAMLFEGESLTYGELDARADVLARRLRALGVKAETRVGLLVERSLDLPAGILGIWKAGGAYVPLDPHQPEARLAFLLDDAIRGQEAAVVVLQEPLRDRLAGLHVEDLALVPVPASGEGGETEPEEPATSPSDLAYLIYTSGTTGQPKAVQVEHGHLAHTLRAAQEAFGFAAGDRMPCLAAFTFDIFLLELLGPLLAGGTSVLFPLKPALEIAPLVEELRRSTLLHAVPALMREVTERVLRKGIATRLRRAFVGGDAVPADLLGEMAQAFPEARIAVLYGPTEAAIIASRHEVRGGGAEDRPLLGRPLSGALLEVRDRHGNLVPAGIPGEVWIGGPGVTRGYLHQPDLTAEKFVQAPDQTAEGRRYRTGDLARHLPDGTLEFLGRIDQQVKIRGFRIELGEIESLLAQHPAVRQAAVLAVGEGDARRLMAVVVPETVPEPGGAAGEELREYLLARLPEYMVPSSIVLLHELPLTAHGKVDRRALGRLAPDRGESREAGAPRTVTEERLAAIWRELLRAERVELEDDFFALGGHSLTATRLLSRVEGELGVDLPLRAVFEAPTVVRLAERIDRAREAAGKSLAHPVHRYPRQEGDPLPLSFGQERLWLIDRIEAGEARYGIPLAVRLRGRLDTAALSAALAEIERRHESLRTTFPAPEGLPRQVVHPFRRRPLPLVDLSALPAAETEAGRRVSAEVARRFDLAAGPLLRAFLFRLSPGEEGAGHVLLLHVHHIVSDAWSTEVLLGELAALYGAGARRQPARLPELPVQYADFALWQREWLGGEALEGQVAWWRRELAGAPALLELPADRPRPEAQTFRGASLPLALPAELAASLRGLGRERESTPFMVLLAGWLALLHRYTGLDDLLVGTPVAGRSRRELEGLIGFFVNTLALRGRPSGEAPFGDLLARVRAEALAAFSNQDLPFERLVEELRVERSLGWNPLFQVLFAFQTSPLRAPELPGLEAELIDLQRGSTPFDLALSVWEAGAAMAGALEYATDLFDAATAGRLLGNFRALLEGAAASPEARLDDLPLLAAPERRQISSRAFRPLPRVPEPGLDEIPAGGAAGAAPRTPTEELLAAFFADLLGKPAVGIRDSFFALGGHSLLATRLAARLERELGVELPLRAVFEAPTVAELAPRVDAALAAGHGVQAPPMIPVPRDRDLPLSFAQERLWFLDRLEPDRSIYNMPFALHLAGDVDLPVLERSLAEIERRHEALRTRFPVAGGQPRQVVDEPRPAGLRMPLVDLSALPPARARQEAMIRLEEEGRRPFDLARGPLWRALAWRLAGREAVALVSLHHIVGDGWSFGVLSRELSALARGEALPGLPVQYPDFAVWQRGWLRGEVLQRELAWWRERLAGAPAVLELPTDRPRPAAQSFRGDVRRRSLPPELAEAVAALARRRGASLFMVLLAAFQTQLHRLSGQEDILVGTPIAGRNRPEVEGLIGFFVNTLAMRGRFPGGEESFLALLDRTRAEALGAYAHQDLPLEKVVEDLRVERSLSHNPLFQVMLALQNAPVGDPDLPGVAARWRELPLHVTKLDLSLSLDESLSLALEHSTDLFDAATAERMLGHFHVLLDAAVADPARPLAGLPLLTAGERHQLLEWNDTALPERTWSPVHRLFERQAAARSEAVAVVFEGQSLTYGDLDARADALAARLRELGVARETRVGLLVERSLDLPAGILGIWKAGGAYVPLDPHQPEARLAFLVEDAILGQDAAVVVTQEPLRGMLSAFDVRAVAVPAAGAATVTAADVAPSDLAYLIYTSGTTGQPKAVLVEHGNLAHTLRASQEAFGFAAGDRMPCLAAFTFDIFLFELLGVLLAGGTSVLFPLKPSLDLARLAGELESATLLHAVPALMRQVVDAARRRASSTNLRRLFVGGDAVPSDLVADLREVFPEARTAILYGPTEAAIIASRHESAAAAGRALLGRPLPGAVLEVRGREGHRAPIGVPGEVWIGGPGVARGYLNRPELTAEKFVDLQDRSAAGRRYRTGDLARFLPDGTLEFLGRIDQQVKVRGFRIELGEIEAVLAGHPGVAQAAVLALGEGESRRLVAYVVAYAAEDGAGSQERLRDHLAARLPDYMVPAAFVFLPELPLTAHGKVDRRALARIEPQAREGVWLAPRTPTEIALAGLWADLLGVEAVGLRDDFFHLGGHSLLATRLVSRIADDFGEAGTELPLRAVFEASTLEALAARVDAARLSGRELQAPPIAPVPKAGDLPLSFSQERLWFLHQLDPESAHYNLSAGLRLDGRLDVGAFWGALAEIVRRHQALRTTFDSVNGRAVQRVRPPQPLPLPVLDLSGLAGRAREDEVLRLLGEEDHRPFDLRRGPVFRAVLLRLEETAWVLFLSMHHIASDGWSTGILIRELSEIYGAFAQGRPSPLPELAVQYADFAVWQRQWLAGGVLERMLAYWRAALAGAPARIDLPLDHPRPAVPRHRGATRPLTLPPELLDAAQTVSRRLGATLFMTLLAAFETLLHRVTGQDDLLVGTPIANRNRAETEALIGCFVNTLALRGRLDPERRDAVSFRELVGRVRSTALEAYVHQDVPFEKLVDELRVERALNVNPLFQVFFALQNAPVGREELPGLALSLVESGADLSLFDLTLGFGDFGGRLLGGMRYNSDLFDAATIDRWAEHFQLLLAGALADPDLPLAELPRLAEPERRQILLEAAPVAAEREEETEEAVRARVAQREGELAQRRSALSERKRAILEEMLRRRSRPPGA